jgi:thiamine biosynthesis protein ThiS
VPDVAELLLTVNGEAVRARAGSTLAELLEQLELPAGRIAVEHNRRVVPRAEHGGLLLHSGDELEIVTFVGGG